MSPKPAPFSENIKKISEEFIKIYEEVATAEQFGLIRICGPGYRKALEFLIKDYLKVRIPGAAKKIEEEFLGKCINGRVDDSRIKALAKRATWLGNDNTHYYRKWVDKDLADLKSLISLTVHWIEMESESERVIKSMPE